jgi:hypothetical protein
VRRPRPGRRAPGKPAVAAVANDAGVNLPEITLRLAGAHGLLVVAALAIARKVGDSSKLARALADVEQARDTLADINRAIEMTGIPIGSERCGDLVLGKAMVLQAIRTDAYDDARRPDDSDVDEDDDEED